MKLGGLGLPGIVISMADFRASAPEICGILHKENLCPIVVDLVPLPHFIPLNQWRLIKDVDVVQPPPPPVHSQQGPIKHQLGHTVAGSRPHCQWWRC